MRKPEIIPPPVIEDPIRSNEPTELDVVCAEIEGYVWYDTPSRPELLHPCDKWNYKECKKPLVIDREMTWHIPLYSNHRETAQRIIDKAIKEKGEEFVEIYDSYRNSDDPPGYQYLGCYYLQQLFAAATALTGHKF